MDARRRADVDSSVFLYRCPGSLRLDCTPDLLNIHNELVFRIHLLLTLRQTTTPRVKQAEGSIRDQAERLRRATLIKGMLLVTILKGKDLGTKRRKASIQIESSGTSRTSRTSRL